MAWASLASASRRRARAEASPASTPPTSLPAANSWDEDVVEVRGTPVCAARTEASLSARSASARATAIS